MHHPLECISRQFFKIFKAIAAIYIEDRVVGIEQFFLALSLIDEEAPRHVFPDILNDRH